MRRFGHFSNGGVQSFHFLSSRTRKWTRPLASPAISLLSPMKAQECTAASPVNVAISAPLSLPGASAGDVRDQLSTLLADRGASQPARLPALNSLLSLNDSRLDGAGSCGARLWPRGQRPPQQDRRTVVQTKSESQLALSADSLDRPVRAFLPNFSTKQREMRSAYCRGDCAWITATRKLFP